MTPFVPLYLTCCLLSRQFGRDDLPACGFQQHCWIWGWLCVQYKVLLYSLDGRLLSSYRAYEWPLGVKSIAWSPSSQFLAIGSFDEKVRNVCCLFYLKHFGELCPNSLPLPHSLSQVRILNHVTWKKITELDHPATISSKNTVSVDPKSLESLAELGCCCLYLKGADGSIAFWMNEFFPAFFPTRVWEWYGNLGM